METLKTPKYSDKICVKNGKVDLKLRCGILKQDDLYIAIIPSLKLTTRSNIGEADLQNNIDHVLKTFFKFYNSKDKLEKELERLGWVKDERMVTNSDLTDKEGIYLAPIEASDPQELQRADIVFEEEVKQLELQDCN